MNKSAAAAHYDNYDDNTRRKSYPRNTSRSMANLIINGTKVMLLFVLETITRNEYVQV